MGPRFDLLMPLPSVIYILLLPLLTSTPLARLPPNDVRPSLSQYIAEPLPSVMLAILVLPVLVKLWYVGVRWALCLCYLAFALFLFAPVTLGDTMGATGIILHNTASFLMIHAFMLHVVVFAYTNGSTPKWIFIVTAVTYLLVMLLTPMESSGYLLHYAQCLLWMWSLWLPIIASQSGPMADG